MKKIGIRRETKNIWEGRTPLIPEHVKELKEKYNILTYIQPSKIRVFKDEEYQEAGAIVKENLSECQIIFGVKEMPVDFFEENKIYIFFSHTIKGQKYNMPMLKRIMDLNCTLIDYEKITDENGNRLIFFGYHAGLAGMIDTLWALGKRYEYEGIKTPFSKIKNAFKYQTLENVEKDFKEIAKEIEENGFPEEISPVVIGITGRGHVSKGAQHIVKLLPYIQIEAKDLKNIIKNYQKNCIYLIVFKPEERVKHIEGKTFSKEDYYKNPSKYISRFDEYLPYLTVLANGIYWEPKFPKLVTKKHIKELFEKYENPKLKVIGDITCDIEGSIEITLKATDPGNPCFVYDPFTETIKDGIEGKGIVVMAVDNLPAELSKDASVFFSNILKNYVPNIVNADYSKSFENLNLPPEIKRAVIVHNGKLTPDFEYLKEYLKDV
ncbi:hypothetical protein DRN73_08955 [Candidatus Pacearchaeota archaeon]|nr:MAG: hypothetical protein DRN73_08955 [Candidatus Pacearchaeota archaeon]